MRMHKRSHNHVTRKVRHPVKVSGSPAYKAERRSRTPRRTYLVPYVQLFERTKSRNRIEQRREIGPTIVLGANTRRPFILDVRKARLVVECIDAIRRFARDNPRPPAPVTRPAPTQKKQPTIRAKGRKIKNSKSRRMRKLMMKSAVPCHAVPKISNSNRGK